MAKTYNTPKRTHIVKTRLDDEEYAEFLRRMKLYEMSQAEFIREAISGATIKPTIVATLVSDDLLAAVGKLTAEYGRIGNNLNQIAQYFHSGGFYSKSMQNEINRHLTALWQLRQEAIKLGGTYHGRVKTHRNKKR